MDAKRTEFLNTMIAILKRLHETSLRHSQPLLADMLAIARTEAEDALRHAGHLDTLAARRASRSSATSWRACDRPPDEPQAEVPTTAAEAEAEAAARFAPPKRKKRRGGEQIAA
jgi:hypothetical protein